MPATMFRAVELKGMRAPLQSLFTALVWPPVSVVLIGSCRRVGGALSARRSSWHLTLSHAWASIYSWLPWESLDRVGICTCSQRRVQDGGLQVDLIRQSCV